MGARGWGGWREAVQPVRPHDRSGPPGRSEPGDDDGAARAASASRTAAARLARAAAACAARLSRR